MKFVDQNQVDYHKLGRTLVEDNQGLKTVGKLIEANVEFIEAESDNYTNLNLSQRVNNDQSGGLGGYMRSIGNHDTLTEAEEKQYASTMKQAKNHYNKLVMVSKTFINQFIETVNEIEDQSVNYKTILDIAHNKQVPSDQKDELINNLVDAKDELNRLQEETDYPLDVGQLLDYKQKVNQALQAVNVNQDRFDSVLSDLSNDQTVMGLTDQAQTVYQETLKAYKRLYDRSFDRLVDHNLKLVVTIAKRFSDQKLEFDDLVQEGNLGLQDAVKNFDPEAGFRFSTYATYWIKQKILKALSEKQSLIKTPSHIDNKLSAILEAKTKLEKEGEKATVKKVAKRSNYSEETVRFVLASDFDPKSLDASALDDDENDTIKELVPNKKAAMPDQAAEQQSLQNKLNKALNNLDNRTKQIVRMYYGLDDHKGLNLSEIGQFFDITRERVRQLRNEGLNYLKNQFGGELKKYL